jgi:hypothetical protein
MSVRVTIIVKSRSFVCYVGLCLRIFTLLGPCRGRRGTSLLTGPKLLLFLLYFLNLYMKKDPPSSLGGGQEEEGIWGCTSSSHHLLHGNRPF